MTIRDNDSIAYTSSQGRGVGHTMRCATVGRYEKLRNGVGAGQCPNLIQSTYGEVMQHIESRSLVECKLCKKQRETEPSRTADGTVATPIEGGDGLQYLVRRSPRTWWVIELTSREINIGSIDLDDQSRASGFMVPGEASRVMAADISDDMPNHPGPGWFFQFGRAAADAPYRSMNDAVDALVRAVVADNAERAQARAERREHQARTAPGARVQSTATGHVGTISSQTQDGRVVVQYPGDRPGFAESVTYHRSEIGDSPDHLATVVPADPGGDAPAPVRCRTHPAVTTDGRHGARLVIPACESGMSYGVWDDNDAGFLTAFDCAVAAADYAAELLDEDPEQVFEIKAQCPDHEDESYDGCQECTREDAEDGEES